MRKPKNRSWYYTQDSDFWSAKPHLCLESVYQYDDEDQTELRQTLVCTNETVGCFNAWDHFFTNESLMTEIQPIGFNGHEFYGDVAGAEFSAASETICVVLIK